VSGALGLPFDEVWFVDFEYHPADGVEGSRNVPVCMVARELGSNRLLRLWRDELLELDEAPFRTDANALFVAYTNSAEMSCFLELGWKMPERSLDLYIEFLVEINGLRATGKGLLQALSHHGLQSITKEEKTVMRDLVLGRGPWTPAQQLAILDYCQGDVDVLPPLRERMLPAIRARSKGLGRAMYRARYMNAVAHMEATGVPIDTGTHNLLRERWDDIKLGLVADVDGAYNVYDGTVFRQWRFAEYLKREGIRWPTLKGRTTLDMASDTFQDMSKTYPQVRELYELRHAMSELRLEKLQVGNDGRNRVWLAPYRAKTGRNQPSNSKFIFGPSKWVRFLITPPPGRALAYLDWTSQEVAIAAYLSADEKLAEAYASGDTYLAFAKMAGLAPEDATKQSHKAIRDICKTVVLGANYGMREWSLAYRVGCSTIRARELLLRLRRAFPTFFAWCSDNQARGQLELTMETVFGWPVNITDEASPNSLLNFPMQGNGSEMLRLACSLVTEDGIDVCAPVHDALLIEADVADIEDAAATAALHMRKASEIVLDGYAAGVDIEKIVRPGERFSDDRGLAMWSKLQVVLARSREAAA
jgi:DNA polymerase-1